MNSHVPVKGWPHVSSGEPGEAPGVVVLADWFTPGFKAGGPISTLTNLIRSTAKDVRFAVITRDRDIGDREAFPSIEAGKFSDTAFGPVLYLRVGHLIALRVCLWLRRMHFDVLYCNSLFSLPFSIAPIWAMKAGLIRSRPVILAPRGELNPGALLGNSRVKSLMLRVARFVGVYNRVIWHATDVSEEHQIRLRFGTGAVIHQLPNLAHTDRDDQPPRSQKRPGHLRLLFVGRVSRMKNLLGAIQMLRQFRGSADYDIYGPIEDRRYYDACVSEAAALSNSVKVRFMGPVPPLELSSRIRDYDLLFLPSLGENFGHAIAESLAAGVPVLISDRTPWRQLADRNAGWDVPLDRPWEYVDILSMCELMTEKDLSRFRIGATRLAAASLNSVETSAQYAALFRAVAAQGSQYVGGSRLEVPR